MKRIFVLLALMLVCSAVVAQSEKQLTHYMFDRMSFNPGATGVKGMAATIVGGRQWFGVEHSPVTALVNLEGHLKQFGSGLGLTYGYDAIGFGRTQNLKLNYSKHFAVGTSGVLSTGIGLGLTSMRFKAMWISPGGDDPNLPLNARGTSFDLDLGVYYQSKQRPFYLGFSTTHVTSPYLEKVNFKLARHYYLLGGYDITNELLPFLNGITLKPSFLVITEGITTTFDLSLLGDVELGSATSLYLGLAYRRSDALAFMIGLTRFKTGESRLMGSSGPDLDRWIIGYAYDHTVSSINQYSKGSHEIVFKYTIFSKGEN